MTPLIAAGLPIAGGLVGSLFNRRRSLPDVTPLINQVNQSAQRQGEITTGLQDKLAPLSTQYNTDIGNTATGLKTDIANRGTQYVNDISSAASKYGTDLNNQLKQRVLSTQPELAQQLREGLASTGQLHNGSGARAFGRLGTDLATQIGQGQQQIALQEEGARQNAMTQAFNADDDAITRATGMNRDMLQKLFESGRQDLIDEATALINEEQNKTGNLLGIEQLRQGRAIAQNSSDAANRADLLKALLGGVGSYLGAKGA